MHVCTEEATRRGRQWPIKPDKGRRIIRKSPYMQLGAEQGEGFVALWPRPKDLMDVVLPPPPPPHPPAPRPVCSPSHLTTARLAAVMQQNVVQPLSRGAAGFLSRIHAAPHCQRRRRRFSGCNQCARILIWPLLNPAHVILHFHAGMGSSRCRARTSGTFPDRCSPQMCYTSAFRGHFCEMCWFVKETLGSK